VTEEEVDGLKDIIFEHLEEAFRGASEHFLRRVADALTFDLLEYVTSCGEPENDFELDEI